MSVGGSFQQSESAPTVVSPFGQLPFGIARGVRGGFAGPLGQAFGLRNPRQETRFQRMLGRAQGPMAAYLRQAQPIVSGALPSMAGLAPELEQGARSAYGGYQQAIDRFMGALPGFQQAAGQATGAGREALGYAQQAAGEAFSPLAGRALFQEASQRALGPAREAMAARGLLEGGQAQAGEQRLLSDLAYQALQGQQAAQQQAIQGLTAAGAGLGQLGGAEAALAGLGPQMAGQLLGAQPALAQLLQGARGLPLGAAQQVMGFLTGAQQPNMALLQQVLPQVAQTSSSKGGGMNVGVSDRRLKRDIAEDVPGLDAVLALTPISFEYAQPSPLELEPGRRYGFFADDVRSVVPHAVSAVQDDYLGIDYRALLPVVVQAIRDLTKRVAELEGRG